MEERATLKLNVWELGSKSSPFMSLAIYFSTALYTLIFPFRINPYTDGRSWARREGYDRHHGLRQGEELIDQEDDEDDY